MQQIAPPLARAYTYDVTASTPIPTDFRDLVKAQARITTLDNTLVDLYLAAAIECFELKTGRDLFTKTYETFRDFFPRWFMNEGYYQGGIPFQQDFRDNNSFLIKKSRLLSVVEIEYDPITAPTVPVIVASTIYYTSNQYDYSEILSRTGEEWPVDLVVPQEQSIRIRFTCGYGTTLSDIPPDIQLGVASYVAWMNENRGDCCADCDIPAAMKMTISKNRIMLI